MSCWDAAEDNVLIFDVDLVELIAKLAPKLHTVKTYIVLTERGCMHKAVSLLASHPVSFSASYILPCAH